MEAMNQPESAMSETLAAMTATPRRTPAAIHRR
jgi:hypothetical protein